MKIKLLSLFLVSVISIFGKPTDIEAYKAENHITSISPITLSGVETDDLKLRFKLEVGELGHVKSVKFLDSSKEASPLVIESIQNSLSKWEFAPGKKNILIPITINTL